MKRIFICLLAISVFSFINPQFRSVSYSSIKLFVFLFACKSGVNASISHDTGQVFVSSHLDDYKSDFLGHLTVMVENQPAFPE